MARRIDWHHRVWTILAGVGSALLAVTTAAATVAPPGRVRPESRQPQQLAPPVAAPTPAIVGILRDESGSVVTDAIVTFVPDVEPDLPALRELLRPGSAQQTTSDARGAFRVASARPGLLLATTGSGLGALVERCWPDRAVRLLMRPMAEVARDDGRAFTIWPAVGDVSGERRHLPPLTGTALRLPAGRYEVWVAAGDEFCWLELLLQSGDRATLPAATAVRRIAAADGAIVFPAGFPHVHLCTVDRAQCSLRGLGARATLFVEHPGDATFAATPAPPELAALASSPATVVDAPPAELLPLQITGADGAEAWLLSRTVRGTFRVLARATARGEGRTQLPLPETSGDRWVVVTATGRAAVALPIGAAQRNPTVHLDSGRWLRCRVADPDGMPGLDVAVTFAAGNGPSLAIAYTNELGEARLGPIAGAGCIRIDDVRFRSVTVPLAADDLQPVAIRLDAGLSVLGQVARPDGTPAANVAVSLRDSLGRLQPAERTVLSGPNGAFAFAGLEPADSLVLFASERRGGHTWSARLRVHSGAADLRLILHNEEPQLLPPDLGR